MPADRAARHQPVPPFRVRHGWGAELGRAAVAYARSVAADRALRTTVPDCRFTWWSAGH